MFFKRAKGFVKAQRVKNQITMLYVFILIRKGFYGFKYNQILMKSQSQKVEMISTRYNKPLVRTLWDSWRRVMIIKNSLKKVTKISRKIKT